MKANWTNKMKHCAVIASIVSAICFPQTSVANSVVDKFENSLHVEGREGSALIEVESGKLIVTAQETEPGIFGRHLSQAIFGWNLPGASASEGFSLKQEDKQFVLAVDMEPLAASGAKVDASIHVYIYFYIVGETERLSESGYIPESDYPQTGAWTFNVLDFAIARFGSESLIPEGIIWRPEFYISTNNQRGVGYRFKSISATDTIRQ